MKDEDSEGENVTATVELTGEYEQIAEILGAHGREYGELSVVLDDIEAVLDIVVRTGGATKGRIVEELPHDVAADIDADAITHVLRVLELYELVALDGNTWRPGAALTSASA